MIATAALDRRPDDAAPNPHGEASTARQRLATACGDDAAMARLRAAARQLDDGSDLSRCDDAALLDQLAAAHVAGRLRPVGQQAPSLRRLAEVQAPPAPAPAAASAPRAPAAAPPSLPDDTFVDLDVEAMVAALRQAAQTGVPFCEECARAAAAERAARSADNGATGASA